MTMTKGEVNALEARINSSRHYLEYGSGASTIYATKSKTTETIDSVESSSAFIDENLSKDPDIVKALSEKRLQFHLVNIGETISWGFPKDQSNQHLWPGYPLCPYYKPKDYDLVLVDGRFRVACALNYILNTSQDCTLMVHDFWNRPQYHVILHYLTTEERIDTLGIFKKKAGVARKEIQDLIRAYQYDSL